MYRVEDAFDKKEMKNILDDVANKLEDNFMFSMDKKYGKHLKSNQPLSDNIIQKFEDNDFPIEPPALVIKSNNKYVIKTGKDRYKVESDGSRLNVYKLDKKLAIKRIDVKGMIVAEIVKRDPCLVFCSRNGLSFTLDNISEWDEEMGKRKASHKKEKRAKKYKDRIDTWWKQAKKQKRKEKFDKIKNKFSLG